VESYSRTQPARSTYARAYHHRVPNEETNN
jgi:hypothetical protein